MALALFDRVQETTTTTGTGTITLAGAVSGFQSFAVVGNGNTCYYTILDGAAWEVGIGTYTASGTTLARTTVLSNSSGTTSPITLSAGSKNVFLTYPAEKSVNLDASGNVSPLGTVSSGVWQGTIVGTLYGGTGVNTSSGANSVMLRDANQNVSINRLNQGSTTVTAAAGITTLTAASTFSQILTGTGNQTFKLPDATTLTATTAFQFNNNATGTLTITDNASATVGTISSGGAADIALLANGTVGGTWDVHAYIPESVTWGTNALVLGSTVITGGTWNGGVIGTAYGGTGLSGATPFTSGGALYATSTSALTSGTLPASSGGTGNSTYTIGDLLYASGTTALSKLADVATGNALISGGVGVAPSWGKIGLTTHVSGTLAAGNGGTGISSYTVGDILYASATGTLSALADVATGNVLLSGGVGVAPSWGKVALGSAVSGNLPVANLNSGTSASSSTYWRGDGTWASVPSSMVYPGSGIPNSTGSAWGTSYGVSGSGSVALTAGPTFTGTVQIAASGVIGLNGGTSFGLGVNAHYNSAVLDTVDSVGSDSLELNYYSGGSVIIGQTATGNKALYAGSLYDAGSRVVSVAGGQSVQSTTYFASNTNSSTSYIYAGIQLRESNYGGSSAYLAPRLAFHWGGVVASQINVAASGRIQMLNNPGTTLENIGFASAYMDGYLRRNNPGVGYLDGQYNAVETASTTGPIYTIGGSYYPTDNSLNNMYGTGYCIGSVAGSAGSSAGSVWGLYVSSNGSARVFLDSDNGRVWATAGGYFGEGLHTGGATGGGFFGSANANKFYNSGGIVEVLLESGSGGPHLEFSASSSYDWHFASTTGGDFYFTQTSTRDIMYMRGSDGWLINNYGFSSPNKYFEITHPIREGYQLRHSSVEGPRYDLIYRGHVTLVDGMAVLNMDTDAVSEGGQTMTPGTFEALTRDADIFVQNQTGWEPVRGSIEGAMLTIVCKDLTSADTVSWMVVVERKDAALTASENQSTDDQGRMLLEVVTTHSASDAATRPLRTKIDIFEGL